MYIEPFGVERWLSDYETSVDYNLTSTSIMPFSLAELVKLVGEDEEKVKEDIFSLTLNYGEIVGKKDYRQGIASLYEKITADQVISTHGGVGASQLTMLSLIEPGDQVIAILPAYQQIYSVPESIGAKVDRVFMEKNKTGYSIDMDKIAALATPQLKAIVFNSPNNPTGDVISDRDLQTIVQIAKKRDAYVVSDEAYRGLTHGSGFSTSVADIYEKGISLGSISKAFALAGLRLGWIATQDASFMQKVHIQRDYTMIASGGIDEYIAALALKNKDIVQKRNLTLTEQRAEKFNDWIASVPRLTCLPSKGGTVALPYYESSLSSADLCRKVIEEKSVLLMPGFVFGLENCFRMGYAREPEDKFEQGLAKLTDFFADLKD